MRGRSFAATKALRLLATVCLILPACAAEEEPEESAQPTEDATPTAGEEASGTPTSTASPDAAGEALEIIGRNYEYEGVPAEMEDGTELTLVNRSENEVHTLLAYRLPESETRSASELAELPDAEMDRLRNEWELPETVIIALPGQEGRVIGGDNTVAQPGRYLFLCLVPTGAEPEAYAQAWTGNAAQPPDVEGGIPHYRRGMYAGVTVR